tara:strand:+ start:57 stop:770 length:714 start_codon:yes stop_codon:yes gene_type:complete
MIKQAKQLIREANKITVLTGAGTSAESGVATFRGQNGLWKGLRPEELASPEGFAADPNKVWEWYNLRRASLMKIECNPGHLALSQLEKDKSDFLLVTQNVDRLHQKAGSKNLIELHGNIWEVRCTACGAVFDETMTSLPPLPKCKKCHNLLRPAVVWFGEQLPSGSFEKAAHNTAKSDVLIVVGTSAVVYPAAGLAQIAKQSGAAVIEVNIENTSNTTIANIFIKGKSGEILPLITK